MLLKRIYDHSGSEPRVIGAKVLRAGPHQHFSPDFITRASAEGWAKLSGQTLTLQTEPPLTYRVLRTPGYYCCHCDRPLDDAASARQHLSEAHDGDASPDPANPAGYRRANYYECERED